MAASQFASDYARPIIRASIALPIAFICEHFLSFSHQGWIVYATCIVMFTSPGSAFFQGLLRFMVWLSIVIFITFIFFNPAMLYPHCYDTTLGAGIGISINTLIFPDQINVRFREIFISLLNSYSLYFSEIVKSLLQFENEGLNVGKLTLEKNLQKLPTWIYSPGFDITLQKGHRYFFMKIVHLSEILFAMHHLARHSYRPDFLERIHAPLIRCVSKITQFINALTSILDSQKLTDNVQDFYADIREIEKDFAESISVELELLDLRKEYVYFAEFIFELKEFHDALFHIAKTLR